MIDTIPIIHSIKYYFFISIRITYRYLSFYTEKNTDEKHVNRVNGFRGFPGVASNLDSEHSARHMSPHFEAFNIECCVSQYLISFPSLPILKQHFRRGTVARTIGKETFLDSTICCLENHDKHSSCPIAQ